MGELMTLQVGDTVRFSTRASERVITGTVTRIIRNEERVITGKITRIDPGAYDCDYPTVYLMTADGLEYCFGMADIFGETWTTEGGSEQWWLGEVQGTSQEIAKEFLTQFPNALQEPQEHLTAALTRWWQRRYWKQ